MESEAVNKLKKAEKIYAYNADSSKIAASSEHHLNFTKISKGFYDELLNYDENIKNSKIDLKAKKQKGIKEFVYTNKKIPDFWKNKITYYDELYRTMSGDKEFVSYLGKVNAAQEEEKGKPIHISKLSKSSLMPSENLKNRTINSNKFSEIEQTPEEDLSPVSRRHHGRGYGNTKMLSPKEVLNILDEYKTNYPIELPKDMIYSNDTMNLTKSVDREKENPMFNTYNSSGARKKGIFGFTGMTKSEVFKSTIYNNLLPPKGKTMSLPKILKKPKKKLYEVPIPSKGIFLNSDEKYYDIIPIENQKVEQKLKDIDNYGPYFSFCPSCRNKNINFYNNMEISQCLKLLNFLKKYRKVHQMKIGES